MQTILQHVEWWKTRLTTMSPKQVKERNRDSLAQIRVWGPAIQAFISSASEHHAISVEAARLVDDAIGAWDEAPLALRLGIVRFVIDRLTVTLQTKAAGADRILGQFATKLLDLPHILSLALAGTDFAAEPGRLAHLRPNGISRAEDRHGTLAKKVRVLPHPVPRLRRRRQSTRR